MERKQGRRLNVLEDLAISRLQSWTDTDNTWQPDYGDWIKILRTYLRMTQRDLANRAGIAQPNLAEIEKGKGDPQISTLKTIFDALSCDLHFSPQPRRPLHEVLRGKARSIALKRLKQSMGTMALEHQAPGKEVFHTLLEKRTDEILSDKRERLWRDDERQNRNRRRDSRR